MAASPAARTYILIQDCLIDNNFASAEGGGIDLEKAFFMIDNCVIEKNRTVDGGGVSFYNSLGTMGGCLVRENQAEHFGGGLMVRQDLSVADPDILLTGNTVVYNQAEFSGAGVMIVRGVTVSLEKNVFAYQGGRAAETIACFGPDAEYHGSCNHFWANGGTELGGCSALDSDTRGDPQFCSAAAGDFRLCSTSPALAGACGQRGAYGVGCTGDACATPVKPSTWGQIKSLYR